MKFKLRFISWLHWNGKLFATCNFLPGVLDSQSPEDLNLMIEPVQAMRKLNRQSWITLSNQFKRKLERSVTAKTSPPTYCNWREARCGIIFKSMWAITVPNLEENLRPFGTGTYGWHSSGMESFGAHSCPRFQRFKVSNGQPRTHHSARNVTFGTLKFAKSFEYEVQNLQRMNESAAALSKICSM